MKCKTIIVGLVFTSTIFLCDVNGQVSIDSKARQWMGGSRGLRFIENKGQMANMQGNRENKLLFKTGSGGTDVYITTSGLSYVFTKIEKHHRLNERNKFHKHGANNDSITGSYCRADMELDGANINKDSIIKEYESGAVTDYYLGGICPDGIKNVHSYGKITVKNIYPGIDWVIYGGKSGMKYNFIVHPGADISSIKLKYKWTDNPEMQNDGSVKISTPLGNIIEGNPVSFCGKSNDKIHTDYIIDKNEMKFKTDKYNSNETLVIDPTLIWATLYGGTSQDDANSIYSDGKNVWVTGWTNSTDFPTLNSGGGTYFQGNRAGTSTNAFILKFTTSGVLKWATYYGGTGSIYGPSDMANSIQSDGTNIWVTGATYSHNFPVLNPGGGAYFLGYNPDTNQGSIFILKFDTSGVRKWATYYGGDRESYGTSIFSDGKNVWLTGYSFANDFPTLNPGGGAYYQGSLGEGCTSVSGYGNACILKFSTTGVLKWATYYGNCNDWGTSIYSDGKNVWTTGNTESESFPIQNPGGGAYFQGYPGGLGKDNLHIYILQFDTGGVRKWATYYGGTKETESDNATCIQSDGSSVWVTGTTGSTDFPTLNPGNGAYYQDTLAGTFYASNAFYFAVYNFRYKEMGYLLRR